MTLIKTMRVFAWVLAAHSLSAAAARAGAQSKTGVNQLTRTERSAGWRLLFDGRTFAGWRGLDHSPVPTSHWKVVAGAIHSVADADIPKTPAGRTASGGDIITVETFDDFEL